MSRIGTLKTVIGEYGVSWAVNRALYSLKIKTMCKLGFTEHWYEKKTAYPNRIDIFRFDFAYLQNFIQELSELDKKQIILVADHACEGLILGFSSLNLNYGNPINWQLNPLTGKQCEENKKWYMISDFDNERGDIKAIWEASRFSHFITLSRAFLLTGARKYYIAFSTQLKEWLEKNSYSYGANFKCGQECSFRMINTLLAYRVFNEAGVITDADASNVKDLVDRCYRKILSNFFYSYKCIKNNHTISELVGMVIGAWCCNDRKRLKRAYLLLDNVINEQFTDDGGYKQFSFNYQRLALQDIEIILSIDSGYRLNDDSIEKIRNAALLLYQCQDRTGDVPNYGNNDGALVFPVTSCLYRDFTPVINSIYALTSGNQLYDSGAHQEELIWFSVGKKLQDYPKTEIIHISSQFSSAGLFTMRGNQSWMMIVANDYQSRPAHMDQNHIDLWVDGVNVLCDAGTFSYASDVRLLDNEYHNTVLVDGKSQMNVKGPFMVFNWTKRSLGECCNNTYEGEISSANGYCHKRKVYLIDEKYEIIDTVDKNYTALFHTPCDIEEVNSGVVLSKDGRKLCEITCSGNMSIKESQRSLYYLKKERTRCLCFEGQANKVNKINIVISKGIYKND